MLNIQYTIGSVAHNAHVLFLCLDHAIQIKYNKLFTMLGNNNDDLINIALKEIWNDDAASYNFTPKKRVFRDALGALGSHVLSYCPKLNNLFVHIAIF